MKGKIVNTSTGVYVVRNGARRVPLTEEFVTKITSGAETPAAFKETVKEIARKGKKER